MESYIILMKYLRGVKKQSPQRFYNVADFVKIL